MTVFELEEILVDALFDYADREDAEPPVRHAEEYLVSTFADAGVSANPGIVVTVDGAEFQLQIVRSK